VSREGYIRDLRALIGPRPVNLIGVAALSSLLSLHAVARVDPLIAIGTVA